MQNGRCMALRNGNEALRQRGFLRSLVGTIFDRIAFLTQMTRDNYSPRD